MQITGEMIHEAFLKVSGEGKSWTEITDAARDRYHAMAKILNVLVERDEIIAEYTRDWLKDNPWMDQQAAHNLAEAGYQQRLREVS
jgi:hypothetical protein